VHRNVAELAEMPRGTRRPSKAMTLDQVCDLLALELTPFWRAYIVTALTFGVRPGELLGLRWRDIDFSQGSSDTDVPEGAPRPGRLRQARADRGGAED
jgi:integrase